MDAATSHSCLGRHTHLVHAVQRATAMGQAGRQVARQRAKSHCGHPWNEAADVLADIASGECP
eukprot:10578967-Alexandrium_andersonii.AAC.1